MTCVRCEVADAERASHVTGFAYVYTAAGFRPMAPGSDPFADAPLAEHEWDQESLRRAHARVAWCRARNQQPGPWAKEGERVYQRERHLRRKHVRAQGVHNYDRWLRTGDPNKVCRKVAKGTVSQRFWAKVDKRGPDECWPWLAFTQRGYGMFGINNRSGVAAHRFAWQEMRGPIPDGLTLDHLCRNRACVNPAHLEPVTAAENTRRAVPYRNYVRTHCKRGHELTEANSYYRPKGGRMCRACCEMRSRKRHVGAAT